MVKFKTRARTVDMLGRQQIAGIPAAISELFKNAHDAFATSVEVDFYRPEQLLVLRDNGLGMTRDDVEERWLVLGTESKLTDADGLADFAESLGFEPRARLGEKGIGRLSIAAIGPQVLLITRAQRSDGLHSSVALFVNWSMFALLGISLDEIDVPVKELPDQSLPSAADVQDMVAAVRHNLDEMRDRISSEAAGEIEEQLAKVSFDPAALQSRFQRAALGGSATGTQFFIQPTDPMLEIALDEPPTRRREADLKKTLMGFTNTMVPDHKEPPIVAEFRDHRSAEFMESVIGAEAFFTPEESRSADHHIQGTFDEYGQFVGTVSIYGQDPEPHTISWPEARGRETECGPFSIDFAYVQGVARESRIPPEKWGLLASKLDKLGGLYIYRNGIRILPYGNTEVDFLRIEERRNQGQGYYFFTHRRMFGAIELPSDTSSRLVEKAGREGFRDNRAYRQFRSILENFLVQLAADYFRDEAAQGEQYQQTKTELDRQAKAREKQARQSRVRRRELVLELKDRADRLSRGEAGDAVRVILKSLAGNLDGAVSISDSDTQIQTILRAEGDARQQIARLREEFRITQPRGFGLPKALRRDLDAYSAEYTKLDEEIFKPAASEIEMVLSTAIPRLGVSVDRRRRFDTSTETTQRSAKSEVAIRERATRTALNNAADRVRSAIQQTVAEFESALSKVSQRVQRTDIVALTDAEFVQLRLELDSEIDSVAVEKRELLDVIAHQLDAITVTPDESGLVVSQLDITEATEQELLSLQERADADLELTQLGMAIEIIDHEFQATIRSVRNNLRRLKAWADVNEQLSDVYDGIRVNFEHLDSYLTLFTPLHRRLYRSEIEIKGSEIGKFLFDLFRERLDRHHIDSQITQAFRRHQVTGYPSTFYPVFVNLIDNAIFWLQDRPEPRIIRLDVRGKTMIVSDNGPGVSPRDRTAIFEMGFTRKPRGRGLGLYISRDVLNRVGYDLVLDDPVEGQGALFRIEPKDKGPDDE